MLLLRRASSHVALACVLVLMTLTACSAMPLGTATKQAVDDTTGLVGPAYTWPVHPPRTSDRRPNMVVVLTDDMRKDDLRFMPATRRLLGRPGRSFSGAVSPHPLCCPARATLLTGQYAQNHGVKSNRGRYGGIDALRRPQNTLGGWLQSTGYATTWHGKYLNGYGAEAPRQPGWTEWDPMVANVYRYYAYRFWGDPGYTEGYVTNELSARTNATVRRFAGPGTPFFMMVNHTAPHGRLSTGQKDGDSDNSRQELAVPERKYADLYPNARLPALDNPSLNRRPAYPDKRSTRFPTILLQKQFQARIRSLKSVDDSVQSLVRTLRDTGELDNTYIVFTSDNGFQVGEHGLLNKNTLYQESLDVPLLIRGPGVRRGVTRTVVSLVDLPATILDIANARPRRPQDGQSLVPFLRGRTPQTWRNTTLVQVGDSTRKADRSGWGARGVQTPRYLYLRHTGDPRRGATVLFDRSTDPSEVVDVARDPRYRAVAAALDARLQALVGCSGRSCNRVFPALPVPLPRR